MLGFILQLWMLLFILREDQRCNTHPWAGTGTHFQSSKFQQALAFSVKGKKIWECLRLLPSVRHSRKVWASLKDKKKKNHQTQNSIIKHIYNYYPHIHYAIFTAHLTLKNSPGLSWDKVNFFPVAGTGPCFRLRMTINTQYIDWGESWPGATAWELPGHQSTSAEQMPGASLALHILVPLLLLLLNLSFISY